MTDEIIAQTGNTKVEVQHLDLSSLASVRKFANNIIDTEPHLDVLINNAGAARVTQKLTEDGLLLGMQVNHFGPFLLTCLLVGMIINMFPRVRRVPYIVKLYFHKLLVPLSTYCILLHHSHFFF
jgi:NAD(P)-dependent dehydrogenase (short-subunit alcohol dehydrogenase family)